jgi:transposase
MSLNIQPIPEVPEETAKIAKAAFPKGNLYMKMRDELGTIYKDEMFLDLYPQDGQRGVAPWRLGLVMVMQFAENLSDRQAAEAVRARIDWKYALSLDLEDAGFDYSVLSEFRKRLIESEASQRLLDAMLEQFKEKGLLKGRGKQRTDSTHILSAVRELSRLENVGETLRHALNDLATVAPEWLVSWMPEEWFDRYGKRIEQYRLPKSKKEQAELAKQIGEDGHLLLEKVYEAEDEPELREAFSVEILRQVWVQQYWCDEGQVKQRPVKSMPPVSQWIQSPYDTEARYCTKRSMGWTGYRVHMTESCDEEAPRIITQVETTVATSPDRDALTIIQDNLADHHLLPAEHLVDAGYVDAANLVDSQRLGVDLIGRTHPDTSWQARMEDGLDGSQFLVDWDAHTVTCPAGKANRGWASGASDFGAPVIYVQFDANDCQECSLKPQCTRGAKRSLTLRPREQYIALQAARQREGTECFREKVRKRAGVEGTFSQASRVCGMRQSRYVGLAKTHLHCLVSAVAVNLLRFVNWLNEVPLARTRTSRLAALAA